MSDIRIRHWGLFPITRRGYLLSQAFVLFAWVALFWVNWRLQRPLPRLPDNAGSIAQAMNAFLPWIPWILMVVAVWWPIDVFFVLRRFRQVEKTKPEVVVPATSSGGQDQAGVAPAKPE